MKSREKKQLVILGAGGHGSELYSYVQELIAQGEEIEVVGFVDEKKRPGAFLGTRILGGFSALKEKIRQAPRQTFYYLTASGDNESRRGLVAKAQGLHLPNLHPIVLIHPQTSIGKEVVIGEGTCLAPASLVTTRVQIGKHCILNVKASVSHDSTIGDFVNLNPAVTICGNVRVADGCYIGAGAVVIDKISIGQGSVIGAGAVVVDDIPAHVTAVGVPARVIKKHRS